MALGDVAADNFAVEAGVVGSLVAFFALYFIGKRRNRGIVDNWCVSCASLTAARTRAQQ